MTEERYNSTIAILQALIISIELACDMRTDMESVKNTFKREATEVIEYIEHVPYIIADIDYIQRRIRVFEAILNNVNNSASIKECAMINYN